MKLKCLIIFFALALLSCSSNKKITGNYYCTCYNDFHPRYVLKIKSNKFELYSSHIVGEKYIGKCEINGDVLSLYRRFDLVNNFKDTLTSLDTSKYVIKGRKLIPFKNEICYLRKTNDKNKLFQIPYSKIDTTRLKR